MEKIKTEKLKKIQNEQKVCSRQTEKGEKSHKNKTGTVKWGE